MFLTGALQSLVCIYATLRSLVQPQPYCRCGKTPLHRAIEAVVGVKNHEFNHHKNQRALFYSPMKYTGNEPIPITHFSLSLHPSIELLPACVSALMEACADVNIQDRCNPCFCFWIAIVLLL
jgi:hypothetical protein